MKTFREFIQDPSIKFREKMNNAQLLYDIKEYGKAYDLVQSANPTNEDEASEKEMFLDQLRSKVTEFSNKEYKRR